MGDHILWPVVNLFVSPFIENISHWFLKESVSSSCFYLDEEIWKVLNQKAFITFYIEKAGQCSKGFFIIKIQHITQTC